jgi:hypothetical protein
MPTALYMYEFRYFDHLRENWLRSRYMAEREEIEERYAQYELIEPPEVRHVAEDWRYADASQLAPSAPRSK